MVSIVTCMNKRMTIGRGVLATFLTLAYILMSFASVKHELTHMAGNARVYSSAVTASPGHVGVAQSSVQGDGGHDAMPLSSESSFCFFCTHNPSILLVVAIAMLIGLLIIRRTYASAIPEKPTLVPVFADISLRAPPVLG
jgi:hypothetical protein